MSREVRTQKLDSLARCLERLREKTPKDAFTLKSSADLQDIVMINLERVVQLSVDLASILIAEKDWQPVPSTMAEAFEVLHRNGAIDEALRGRMQKSVGFRNLCVHEYDKINWDIVFSILTKHLEDFKRFAGAMDAIP